MAGNTVTLNFGGDSTDLTRAAEQASDSVNAVDDSVTTASDDMAAAGDSSGGLTTKLGHLGSAVDGATTAIDAVSGSLTAVNDLMNLSSNRAAEQRRKLIAVDQAALDLKQAYRDLDQAQGDLNQSMIDAKQGGINAETALLDARQATLDAAEAQKAYNEAVKAGGPKSAEAIQAGIDLAAAQIALKQANLDGEQATEEIAQANRDGKQSMLDATGASINARTAQEDLNEAMLAAHPPALQKWAENLQLIAPIITAVVGVVGLLTAAQWLWNAALWASPVTWIVLAIITLVAIIVIVATKTTWFQDIWKVTWGGIKDAAQAVGEWFAGPFADFFVKLWNGIVTGVIWLKDMVVFQFNALKGVAVTVGDFLVSIPGRIGTAFRAVTSFIFEPFRSAFNSISRAWNNTVGRLSWTVPGWVPGFGGNSISAPKLPTFHTGGIVSGALGTETLALLRAGERVTASGGSGSYDNLNVTVELIGDGVIRVVEAHVEKRGGNVQRVLGNTRG